MERDATRERFSRQTQLLVLTPLGSGGEFLHVPRTCKRQEILPNSARGHGTAIWTPAMTLTKMICAVFNDYSVLFWLRREAAFVRCDTSGLSLAGVFPMPSHTLELQH